MENFARRMMLFATIGILTAFITRSFSPMLGAGVGAIIGFASVRIQPKRFAMFKKDQQE
ncbi:hypothetical protein OS190_01995 [Sulfitobacter sp. F26204]|uniref:hypothetical protein n=1 Tax=Sulfitobacter sp. F26204 TaxID=2996014 RepID=UPI00225DE373|nr:hypothetical protein [Sulfitobacter sp. F26204]MCX7558323.1 hypothetical protein [Sulfitobacter sp. F26204]